MAVLTVSPSAFSKKMEAGFVARDLTRLETAVRAGHDIREILEMSAQLRSFNEWPADMDQDFKLYIAARWFSQRYIDEALKLVESIAPSPPFADLYRFYHASLLLEKGDSAHARAYVEDLMARRPENPDTLFLQSSFLAVGQDFIGATRALTEIIRRDGNNGIAYLQRGMLYIISLSNELAIKDLIKAIRLLPKDDIHHRQMAYFQAGFIEIKFLHNPKKARKLFHDGFAINPDSALAAQVRTQFNAFTFSDVSSPPS